MSLVACRDTWRLLVDNPDLSKTILAGGLLVSGLSVGTPLVLTEVKSEVWEKDMSSNSAAVAVAVGVVSVVLGGTFGRITDRIERRLAMSLVGVLCYMQWYMLLIFGPNRIGLIVFCVCQIVAGVTCMTPTGCPMIFTLTADVMPKDNAEFAFGVSYTCVYLVALLCSLLGVFVARTHAGEPRVVLFYIVALSVAFHAVIFSIRPLPPQSKRLERSSGAGDKDGDAAHMDSSESSEDAAGDVKQVSLLGPFRFAFRNAPLRNLCFVAALVSLPEIVLADVTQQFIYKELGLLGTHDRSRKQLASLLSTYPGLLATLPSYFFIGLAAKRMGALRLLRRAIPVSAVLMTLPMFLCIFPSMWFVTIAGIALNLSMVIFTPLQTVNAQIAPVRHIGEAMAAVGVAKQLASMCGNLIVHFFVPLFQFLGLSHPLRYFFPASGVFCLLSLVFAVRIQIPKTGCAVQDSSPKRAADADSEWSSESEDADETAEIS